MSRLITPPGLAKGCLPRTDRVGDACEVASKAIDIIPRDKWKDYIPEVNYRQHRKFTFYQGNVGSCATESTSMGVMLKNVQMGRPFNKLNPWSMYCVTSGGRDEGSSIGDNLEHARIKGICSDSVFPRYKADERTVINRWYKKPNAEAQKEARHNRIDEYCDCSSVLDVGACLCLGIIVVYGWDGHSCILLHLLDENTALALNSWGSDWGGDSGCFRMDLREIDFRYGSFGIMSIRYSTAV